MSFNIENLTATGILAVVLSWFMLRMENILTLNTKAINNLAKVITKCPGGLSEDPFEMEDKKND